ncbi:hypothetical protein CRE_02730 [Caenorhabditis remanei]|uniref:Thymidine kinase n=1 Tax=Caenorhabditis remanei TaxID=31234 RepID=E3NQ81_CAERE|nr:hypothetical protein CRE_02730 [Caenorhabditis remanei]
MCTMDAEAVKNEMTCCSSNSSLSDFNTLPRCPNRVGSITVILGPMFSGKTTELLRLHDRQIIAKRTCVLVKYAGKPFPQISLLLPYANEIKQVTAVCVECGSQANFSFRSTLDKKVEVIGGADTYTALCRECYVQKSEEKDAEEQLKTGCDKNENDITGIVMAKKEQRSDGSVSPPRKKIGLSKSVALESTVRI